MKMTKQAMIDKVQEIKADYQQVLKHIALTKRRFRDTLTEQQANGLNDLYEEVEHDYSCFCELEKEAYKPRNKKADMEQSWEDVLSYDADLWNKVRPTLNLRIEEFKAQAESAQQQEKSQEKADVEKVEKSQENTPQEETQQEEKTMCGKCAHWAGLPLAGKTNDYHIGMCEKCQVVAMSGTVNRCGKYSPRSRVPTGGISP